ncbi:hypothetical protein ACFX2I_000777 [Malus domestica]
MSSGDGDSMEVKYIWRHHRHEPRKNQGTSGSGQAHQSPCASRKPLSPYLNEDGDLINDARATPSDDVAKNFAPGR